VDDQLFGFAEIDMAHAKLLPQDVLANIAREVSKRLPPPALGAMTPGATLEVADTFPIYMLGLDATTHLNKTFSELAINTGDWYHLIRSSTGEHLSARSTANGPDAQDWQLLSLSRSSDLAKRVDEAIVWIDSNVLGDAETRMLKIPAYFITAFWLLDLGKDEIVLVDMPKRSTNLQYGRVYTATEFLTIVSAERHSQGVPRR
jgi:hypothetical protein